ncbi:hypothetical protein VPH35_087720 [Triticum aestivum]
MRIALVTLLTLAVLLLGSDVEAEQLQCTTAVIKRPGGCSNSTCEYDCDQKRKPICGPRCSWKANCVGGSCKCLVCNVKETTML